jgi:hypothetical protein
MDELRLGGFEIFVGYFEIMVCRFNFMCMFKLPFLGFFPLKPEDSFFIDKVNPPKTGYQDYGIDYVGQPASVPGRKDFKCIAYRFGPVICPLIPGPV